MSGMLLVIGNKNYSSWSLRPWVFMMQNNIPFQEKRIALFTDATNDELAPYNSDFKVPVLQDDDFMVWDSLAILEYVANKFPESNGWPTDLRARAIARSVSCEMHSSFTNVRNELPMNVRKIFTGIQLSPEAEREVARIQALWEHCRSEYGQDGPWLFGQYSIADAMYAPVALRFAGYSIALSESARIYVQTILEQPCIQAWIEAGKAEKEVIEEDEIKIE